MWNDEIKQNIINELNQQLGPIATKVPAENHSYADSIFSPITTNMFKPISTDIFEAPNYFETMINRTRTIKEVPVHTLAFADSFETKVPATMSFAYAPTSSNSTIDVRPNDVEQIYDMDNIINSSNAITISLTPEQRGVAVAKRFSWKDIWFGDVTLIKNTSFAEAIKKFCSIKI